MEKRLYITGDSPALLYAETELKIQGVPFAASPEEADVLLYNVPTAAFLRNDIPKSKFIIGGNLDFLDAGIEKIDLMKDAYYVTANAALTAEAALGLLIPKLECDFSSAPTLVIGWGRIGKCMAKLLKAVGIPVFVFARRAEDRAILEALGYEALTPGSPLPYCKCVINTVPAKVFDTFDPHTIKIDLASVQGIPGTDVIHARGLPGKCKAEASGKLIARIILRHREEVF